MSKIALYPLKFKPILKPTIWGGKKLGSYLNKPLGEIDQCGESWEISGVKENISEVADGPLRSTSLSQLISSYKSDLLGKAPYAKYGQSFPLLIKYIDANQDLSIQVHPNDELARKRHNSFGKTEMWYVMNADAGASLISGFNRKTTKEEYLKYFNSGRLTDLLNREVVKKDDVFFLPAGRVHTIGQGLLIAEIQQTSDITYRIYDFDRVDKLGNKRELHVEAALDAIDFNFYEDYKTSYDKTIDVVNLVSCNYFTTNKLTCKAKMNKHYASIDSFVILMALEGEGTLNTEADSFSFKQGDTYLIPAMLNSIEIIPSKPLTLLEVYLPS